MMMPWEAVTEVPWTTLGIGGILAGVVLVFYRSDRKDSEKRHAEVAENYRSIVESNTRAMTEVKMAVEHNTAATEATRQAMERFKWRP